MPGLHDFEQRMQEWKQADAVAAKAGEQFRSALLDGAQDDHAERLHAEVLKLRAHADGLLTALLKDMERLSGKCSK